MVWLSRTWVPASVMVRPDESLRVIYPAAAPLFPTTQSWHDGDRARDETFRQAGIYVSYAPALDDPRLWSPPARIMDGGKWYPQVIGLEQNGTDKEAGELARFFMSGVSNHFIRFIR